MSMTKTSAGGEFRDRTHPCDPPPVGYATGALVRWCRQLLDGPHDWGSVDVSPTRHGVTRYRLVVFPPGIDTVERRLLRAWRAWPTWGAALWLLGQVILSALLTPATALAASTVTYLAAGAILFACVAEVRSRVPTLSVVRIAGFTDERSAAMFAEVKSLVAALCDADDLRDRAECSAADHEASWWQVYDRLGRIHPEPAALD